MLGLSDETLLALWEIAELTKGRLLSGNTSRGAVCTAGMVSGDPRSLKGKEQGSSCLAPGLTVGWDCGGGRAEAELSGLRVEWGQVRVRARARPGSPELGVW